MPESVLTILKFCFLALLYLFLFRVVRVVVKELRAPAPVPQQPAAPPAAAPAPASRPAKPARGRGPGHLRILEPRARQGESYALTDEVTVGRGGGCAIVLADDSFVSTVHARVFRRDGVRLRGGSRLPQRHPAQRRARDPRRAAPARRPGAVRPDRGRGRAVTR